MGSLFTRRAVVAGGAPAFVLASSGIVRAQARRKAKIAVLHSRPTARRGLQKRPLRQSRTTSISSRASGATPCSNRVPNWSRSSATTSTLQPGAASQHFQANSRMVIADVCLSVPRCRSHEESIEERRRQRIGQNRLGPAGIRMVNAGIFRRAQREPEARQANQDPG